jgi:protein involved in polysaccharide export with SLBB domain
MPVPDLEKIWTNRSPDRNIILDRGDYIVIPMTRLSVTVAGEVNSAQAAIPYVSGYTVGDYIQAAGGINPQTGDSNAIYFVSTMGKKSKVGLGTEVPPGTTIYVAKNSFTNMQQFFSNLFVITGWITGIVGVTVTVLDFANRIR